ncbi:uncharacterized protein LOC17876163 [Capsella rubella]|uniref:uncharacterized protein LOC17876163 n=1 Tax=Capsella rubella TaxID=81985 RepID=UPI000CD4B9D7|nr:uncharacterized protein LOC17876163 [Capsella rubella]
MLGLVFLCVFLLSTPCFSLSQYGGNEFESRVSLFSDENSGNVTAPSYVTCQDLDGVGSLNTTCTVNSNLRFDSDLYVYGTGNLNILAHVLVDCPIEGCMITFNVSGNIHVGQSARIVAGSVVFSAINLTMDSNSSIYTTALAGPPPSQTSGTPYGIDGAGGGHGGRGASCLKSNITTYWGGDVYAWSSLHEPWSYGSEGGVNKSTSKFRGKGGGRVKLLMNDTIHMNGTVSANGGDGGQEGGGGSGGSIFIHSVKLKGYGKLSASGGSGWGGGGGGRISLDCYSIQEDIKVLVHGGASMGCPKNAGAAGTYFNRDLLSLRVGNENMTTETETPLLDFPTRPPWSNIYVDNNAKVLVPLLWTRMQVRGQISLYRGSSIVFGLSQYPISEFELVAEELLMSNSVIKVYGALRLVTKMLLMLNSVIQIDGEGNPAVPSSVLEVRNLAVLTEKSIITSNANLGVYGQGMLTLTGLGDAIKGQRLSLSQFYNITVGPGSILQAPLDDYESKNAVTRTLCDSKTCPIDLISPPDDCHVNYTLSFSLQICRVEDILVSGLVKGSIIQIHRARTVVVTDDGLITASEFGCSGGLGKGLYSNGAGSGAGHGGRGGSGIFNGRVCNGGHTYGDPDFPCELGSGAESPDKSYGNVTGGGMIVIGSIQFPLFILNLRGSLSSDGQSLGKPIVNGNRSLVGGVGGGSGGTILLFLQMLELSKSSSLSVQGGRGGPLGGGGGGGGRLHFHWDMLHTGDEYSPVATVKGSISSRGGAGDNGGRFGEEGTMTGKKCPKGLYGTFCLECPIGTYKNVEGSDKRLCTPCPPEHLPSRAKFVYVRGGVSEPVCPYKCVSDKYRMPNCYTPLEELFYAFGGPFPFALLLSCVVVVLGLLLSTLSIKLLRLSFYGANSIEHQSAHCLPHLLSLSEVRGAKSEDTQTHAYRMYFMGPNTFREPWHLPYSPPDAIIEIVYEDAFNRFIDEINSTAAYDWWEGSVHSILSVLANPCAWSWKQWRRRRKIHRLQEYVKSQYDHSCLRSCRSRALYKGMKVGATPDLMVAYIDFFLGGDEKRVDMVSIIQKRFPMCILFGGDGSYMSPYSLHSDTLLTNLLGQHIPPSVWHRFVAGLNAQLRTVRHGSIRSALLPVIRWINSHGNPQLEFHGVRIELGWFQATASGYYQLGILVFVGDFPLNTVDQSISFRSDDESPRSACPSKSLIELQQNLIQPGHGLSRKRINGGINGGLINEISLDSLEYRRDLLFPFSLLLNNTRPIGRQDTLLRLISILLLADLSVTLLALLQFYWLALAAFLAILLILPLSLLCPFPAGLNALFSKEMRRASLTRIYGLWNATSLTNVIVAFICGVIHSGFFSEEIPNIWNAIRDDDKWWVLPTILLLLKSIQARFLDWHVANLEVPDFSLLCPDPDTFWAYESGA